MSAQSDTGPVVQVASRRSSEPDAAVASAPATPSATSPSVPFAARGVEVHGISKRYATDWAVRDLDLALKVGEFSCLLGPSGCGKTTTLRMLAGFVEPTEGSIFVNGHEITHLPARRRNMGVVFQDYALFPHMTATQNIGYGLRVRRAGSDQIRRRTSELLELVRLTGKGDKLPHQLSGGEQQRVAVARALAIDPSVLLLDEPLSNLDARLRVDVGTELRRIHDETGITTLMVTHDQEEAFALADSIAIMRSGRVEQKGTSLELYSDPSSAFVAQFIGRVNLIEGRIRSTRPLTVMCGDLTFEADDATAPGLRVNDTCTFMVRPEAIKLSASSSGTSSYEGTVVSSTFTGALRKHRVRVGTEILEIHALAQEHAYAVGDVVYVSWSTTDARILPPESDPDAADQTA